MTYTGKLGTWVTVFSLTIAGICFVLFPVIRPFSDQSILTTAEAFASYSWLFSHSLSMVGFILLTLGFLGIYTSIHKMNTGFLSIMALIIIWIAVSLILPYYGAETFSLYSVGKEALKQNNNELLLTLTNMIRYGEGIWFFGSGLILISIGAILFAIVIWRSGIVIRWSGIPLAIGISLLIPQFYASQPVRIAHGLLVMAGCWLIAWSMLKLQHDKDSNHIVRQKIT